MMMNQELQDQFIRILEEELIPSFGCSDPGCIAFVSSAAAKALGVFPDRMVLKLCGPLIKNATGVFVPNSGHLRGTNAAGIMGVVCGDPDKKLESISEATDADRAKVRELLAKGDFCRTELLTDCPGWTAIAQVFAGDDWAEAVVMHRPQNLTKLTRNGEVLFEIADAEAQEQDGQVVDDKCDRSLLTVERIWDFAHTVELDKVAPIILRQVEHNMKIAEAGMTGDYGPCIGQTIMKRYGNDPLQKAKAYGVAGADARMSGCALSVITNSMSGNQGVVVCAPVVTYAKEINATEEQMIRALIISNLITIRIRRDMGTIPPFCGQVNAATGSACAIVYLTGGGLEEVNATIRNSLANVSGMMCDGAKPSCAAKIAAALDAAFLGYDLAMQGISLEDGTGIIKDDVEKMIDGLGLVVRKGMDGMNEVILQVMVD